MSEDRKDDYPVMEEEWARNFEKWRYGATRFAYWREGVAITLTDLLDTYQKKLGHPEGRIMLDGAYSFRRGYIAAIEEVLGTLRQMNDDQMGYLQEFLTSEYQSLTSLNPGHEGTENMNSE